VAANFGHHSFDLSCGHGIDRMGGRGNSCAKGRAMMPGGEFFGFILTVGAFLAASKLNKKWPSPLSEPLLVATVFVIAFLALSGIPHADYARGANILNYFLAPAIICLAVPVYRQIKLIKRDLPAIMVSIFIGCAVSVLAVFGLCALFGIGDVIAKSLAAVSVSTAMAVGITEQLGGLVPLTVAAVIVTGVLGAAAGAIVCKILGIRNPIAQGLAIGNASHAAGTAKAMQMGPRQGAASSLAIAVSGIMTALIAPVALWLMSAK
jgi:predicted murein hydrolase (TIGR00659 family)